MEFLGGGAGIYLKDGENRGLVQLKGQKRYRGTQGGYWLSVLVELNGEVVEFLPNEWGECMPVSEILSDNESPSKLRQDVNDCILISF